MIDYMSASLRRRCLGSRRSEIGQGLEPSSSLRMKETKKEESGRREFLRWLSAGALAPVLIDGWMFAAPVSGSKSLRGIFPIAQTPFKESGSLDLDSLAEEVRFIERGRAHGFVWPQNASEWKSLTERERFEGAEAITAVGKQLRPAIVIGVQAPDVATAIRYAKRAQKVGADAVISLPPEDSAPNDILDYYKQLGSATDLPLIVQAVGNLSVDLILQMYKAIPTMRYIKDEAENPLTRIGQLREKSSDGIRVFSGNHGRTLIGEMRRGFSGSMPAASFADLYAATWDLWQAGHHQEAMEMHGKTLLILTEVDINGFESLKYILFLRGVFKTYRVRRLGGPEPDQPLGDEGKQAIRETLDYLKPYLRA
jgi:dihydrodipicolinate synthase/N-acetylneuraminate lyase